MNDDRHIETDGDTLESDRLESLIEALIEKSGAFIGDGIEQSEADRLAIAMVQCRQCHHYRAEDRLDGADGVGTCAAGAWPLSRSAKYRGANTNAPNYCMQFTAGEPS